jgi:hypothetical protein
MKKILFIIILILSSYIVSAQYGNVTGIYVKATNTLIIITDSIKGTTQISNIDTLLATKLYVDNATAGFDSMTIENEWLKIYKEGAVLDSAYLGDYLKTVDITDINATGTPSDSTFLRGDGTWSKSTNYFEKELSEAENNINVGFTLNSKCAVFFNGQVLPQTVWNGEGTTTLSLSLDIKVYDKLIVKQ